MLKIINISDISVNELPKNKLFVFHPDKKTIAYEFDNEADAARCLTPKRISRPSDVELNQNKNLQHIRRVINKNILTNTEKGKFYIFKNPGHSLSLALVPWGINLISNVGNKITTEEAKLFKFPSFQFSVIIGLLLSDGWVSKNIKARAKNAYLGFAQSVDHSRYFFFCIFSALSLLFF